MLRVPESKWVWLGYAGHLCVADRCRFHLHTHIGRWCVSTVGHYVPFNSKDGAMDTIGWNRYFETMVFLLDKEGDDEAAEPMSWSGVEMAGSNTAREAAAEHRRLCLLAASDEWCVEDEEMRIARDITF